MAVVHYRPGDGRMLGNLIVCAAWKRDPTPPCTSVKADVTCRRCIRYFKNSATPEQRALIGMG